MEQMDKLLIDLFDQIDRTVKEVAKQFPREFKCKKGCSDCCNAAFDVSLVEAWAINRALQTLERQSRRYIQKRAKRAHKIWERDILGMGKDISLVRIPCPLLSKENQCILYPIRPVNCRTYGVPTEINGQGRVCSLSGFKPGRSYPTIRLHVIQTELLRLSSLLQREQANKRYTIAQVVLGYL